MKCKIAIQLNHSLFIGEVTVRQKIDDPLQIVLVGEAEMRGEPKMLEEAAFANFDVVGWEKE